MDDPADPGPAQDLEHPIPRLDALDTVVTHERGAYVGIVIASPLRDDPLSRARLLRKIEVTLQYFQSPEFTKRCGQPTPQRCKVYISVHSGSDPAMIDLVEDCRARISEVGATPVISLTHVN